MLSAPTIVTLAVAFAIAFASPSLTSPNQPLLERNSHGSPFPLQDNFPSPNKDQLDKIVDRAHGSLPDGPPPQSLSKEGVTSLQLIALNELLEVAFFVELHRNISQRLAGYDLGSSHAPVLDALDAIIAQEELHALSANSALQHFGYSPMQPCVYRFPVADFQTAITLASTFTAVVLGTLQDISQIFAREGDLALLRTMSSIIGNEGEQQGFFRLAQGRRPSSQPFLTTSVRDFAFTAIMGLTEPGSCPNADEIPLKHFKPLVVTANNSTENFKNIGFSFAKRAGEIVDYNQLHLVHINQQNVPFVHPLIYFEDKGNNIAFDAKLSSKEHALSGLAIVAVTRSEGPFADANAVAEVTIFGPAFIDFN